MNYEIHITVQTTNIDKFINDCKSINVKPIIIETQNDVKFDEQVMTSSKHSENNHLLTIDELCSKLLNKGYKILRKKVEIQPGEEKHPEHIYYESHLRLKLPNDFKSYDSLYKLCEVNNFHLSKNIFKKDEDFIWQMITYRSEKDNYNWFIWCIELMKAKLKNIGIKHDKIEIEECIYDSNVEIDNNWLKN